MLSRSHRLSNTQVAAIMEKGRVIHTPLFVARWIPVAGNARVAAIVPQKVGKTAVLRTQTRRKIYGVIRKLKLHEGGSFEMAIFAKQPAVSATSLDMEADLKEIFSKVK